jgi:hypothetical protein
MDMSKVELCVSNNASEQDYSAVERLLKTAPKSLKINYVKQPIRLPIDEHMFAVKNLATSSYIYFLGDDDCFLEGQLPLLLDLIEREAPDLAIFNGVLVNRQNEVIGSHFSLSPQRYSSIANAFIDLRDKGMFGAVLVKASHIDNAAFKRLFGTDHGYGCYWFSLLSDDLCQASPIVMIPSFPLVALKMAEKTYNILEVYYRNIPYEIAVYRRFLPAGAAQQLQAQFKARYQKKISSVLFLIQMCNAGCDIKSIRNIDPEFYRQHRLKITICNLCFKKGVYNYFKHIYKKILHSRKAHYFSGGPFSSSFS